MAPATEESLTIKYPTIEMAEKTCSAGLDVGFKFKQQVVGRTRGFPIDADSSDSPNNWSGDSILVMGGSSWHMAGCAHTQIHHTEVLVRVWLC